MRDIHALMRRAYERGTLIPAFNVAHLPIMEPIVRALRDTNSFGLVMVARLEWEKFGAGSIEAIAAEYRQYGDPQHTRLHLDHVPVIDEDDLRVPYADLLARGIAAGYDSLMVDGSRLPLDENIEVTRRIVEMGHAAGRPVEAELGAVLGHEEGPPPPYDELFASGKGFTDVEEARRFVKETGVDWLSVAIGNVHGAIAKARRSEAKVAARLDIEHLKRLRDATGVPLVLHGGSGIQKSYIQQAVKTGIAKINVGTALRQRYEALASTSVEQAQAAVYDTMLDIIRNELEIEGSAARLL